MIKTKEIGRALAELPVGTLTKVVGIGGNNGLQTDPVEVLKVGRIVSKAGITVDCNTVLDNIDIYSYQWVNAPIVGAAILKTRMYDGTRGMQWYHMISGINPTVEVYVRGCVGGTWVVWKKIE